MHASCYTRFQIFFGTRTSVNPLVTRTGMLEDVELKMRTFCVCLDDVRRSDNLYSTRIYFRNMGLAEAETGICGM